MCSSTLGDCRDVQACMISENALHPCQLEKLHVEGRALESSQQMLVVSPVDF